MILGILAGMSRMAIEVIPLPVIATLFIPLWLLPFFSKSIFSYKLRWIPGLLFCLLLFVLTFEITLFSGGKTVRKSVRNSPSKERIYIADIIEPVVQKANSTKAIFRISAYLENGKWQKVDEKVLAYIQREEQTQELFYGDHLIISCLLTEPEPSVIPGSFNYKKFLNTRGIFLKTYIKKQHWRQLNSNGLNLLYYHALSLRRKLLEILKERGLEGREFGVTSALLLGYVDEIDSDLMKDYAATGVLHILSVSGMHVGMIFLVLEKLLSFLDKWKSGRIIKTILSILLIWSYALITGLSPAVLRAAAMLSLVIAGKSLKRNPDILNILAASFFFLLVWDPKLLMDMGFQLSYLAVVGIVLLYKPIYERIVFTNWLLDKVWSLISVSIAAQLITTPLSLFYFHQFPNYFLLANIFVVPLSNLIIYDGILTLILSGIPFLSMILAKLLAWSVTFLNGSIHFIGSLPGSVTHGLFLRLHEMMFLYGILLMICFYIVYKQKKWFYLFLLMLIFLQGSLFIRKSVNYNVRHFFVYKVKNSALYDCIGRGSSILTGDISNLDNPIFADNLKKSWDVLETNSKYQLLFFPHIKNVHTFKDPGIFFKKGNFIQFYQKRIGILTKKIPLGSIRRLNLDWLIVSGNPKIKLADIERIYCVKTIIIDNSNSPWKVREWVKEAEKMRIQCYSVPDEGPFMSDF
jgi:competence protein ComEC